jgi:hypothetical protein
LFLVLLMNWRLLSRAATRMPHTEEKHKSQHRDG